MTPLPETRVHLRFLRGGGHLQEKALPFLRRAITSRRALPAASITATNPSQWAALAFLRFFLALVVTLTHLKWFLPVTPDWVQLAWELDGKAAVIGFLLVSGFSIHSSLAAKDDGFLQRRLLRVYPLYCASLMLAIALEWWQGGVVDVAHQHFQALGTWTAVGNLLLLQMFVVKPIVFNGPVWSLSLEFFYYVCARKIRDHAYLATAVMAVSLVCFILPRRTDLGLAYTLITKFGALTYAWPWILGFFLWHKRSLPVLLALGAGAVAVVYSSYYISGRFAVLTYLLSVLVILGSYRASIPGGVAKVFNVLGDLSYPLYLFHLPVFIAVAVTTRATSPAAYGTAALATSAIMLVLVDRYLKRRFFRGWFHAAAGLAATWQARWSGASPVPPAPIETENV